MKKLTKKLEGIFLLMLFASLMSGSLNSTDAQTGDLPGRDQIEEQYTWNLKDLYDNEEKWEKDYKWLEEQIPVYKGYEGKLGKSADALYEFIQFDEKLSKVFDILMRYVSLAKDLDLRDSKYQGMYERASSLGSRLATAGSFVRPELLSIPEETLWNFVDQNEELKLYKHQLDNLLRMKPHTLSAEMEELLALSGPVRQVPYNAFSLFSDADLQFPSVKDEEGNEIAISHGRYYAALESPDRGYRERVYRGFYKPFMDYENTFSALFNGNLKSIHFGAQARKYKTDREAALSVNNIPVEVYDNLVNACNDNFGPIHRWGELKKKILGIDELHAYDTYVTLFPSVSKDYTYDESKEILLEALKPLGDDYLAALKNAFDNRWIDVYETKGKRSGAYSSGVTFGKHPYVLLNWNNQLGDVFTFAHEMGHNMHSWFTEQTQPYPYADYSIFVAEVASTMNEAFLLDYLIEKAESKEEKLALIERNLNNITTTFFRQTRFAEFENVVHNLNAEGAALTPDKLCELYGEMYQKYWGAAMVVDKEESYTWARIPHFYYNFYVYQYATSFAASQALTQKVKEEGQPAIDKYLTFLKSGSSMYPIEILKVAGVDMTTADPIVAVVNKMNSLLDQMEELLAE
ncbi:MAG: oligoendopeptidase F [Melioribacteraceae bacterium]|nr:oligoendopeptidase F [Melioribacteraceae bacterium]MCF8355813.1 oligoendopeptidase F [Melioribacteraceae bacterium]MCF8395303.1 oligoendopeptidase F [Melioribacteraceae bacterium]MCF8420751.1 oligoendopeptidase F [Melioribacteraceae bacterium]